MQKGKADARAGKIGRGHRFAAYRRCWTDVEVRYPIDRAAGVTMRYKVVLIRSDEGVSVSVPGLPGCWSQGATDEEALDNIRTAIQEYLSVVAEQTRGAEVREVEVGV